MQSNGNKTLKYNILYLLGTISSRLVRDFKLKHLASGDILRNQIAEKTEVGIEAEQYLQKGQLVPDPLIVALISSELTSVKQNWLLDGKFRFTLKKGVNKF